MVFETKDKITNKNSISCKKLFIYRIRKMTKKDYGHAVELSCNKKLRGERKCFKILTM